MELFEEILKQQEETIKLIKLDITEARQHYEQQKKAELAPKNVKLDTQELETRLRNLYALMEQFKRENESLFKNRFNLLDEKIEAQKKQFNYTYILAFVLLILISLFAGYQMFELKTKKERITKLEQDISFVKGFISHLETKKIKNLEQYFEEYKKTQAVGK